MKNSNRKPVLELIGEQLKQRPMTSREIAEIIDRDLGCVRTSMSYLVQQGKAKIVGTTVMGKHGRSSYLYISTEEKKPCFSDKILELLKDHPGLSAGEIAEELKQHPKAKSIVSGTLHRMLYRNKQIRISGYRLNLASHRQIALYSVANGKPSVPKPKSTFTNADHCARYSARKKARKPSVFGQLIAA